MNHIYKNVTKGFFFFFFFFCGSTLFQIKIKFTIFGDGAYHGLVMQNKNRTKVRYNISKQIVLTF